MQIGGSELQNIIRPECDRRNERLYSWSATALWNVAVDGALLLESWSYEPIQALCGFLSFGSSLVTIPPLFVSFEGVQSLRGSSFLPCSTFGKLYRTVPGQPRITWYCSS